MTFTMEEQLTRLVRPATDEAKTGKFMVVAETSGNGRRLRFRDELKAQIEHRARLIPDWR